MCYKPLSMVTPSQKISLYGGQQIKLQFGCGKCCQCLQKKQLEYHYRTYYECQDTFKKGGYVMAITLTYAPKCVPKLSHLIDVDKYGLRDCMLFDYTHYQKLLKLVRIRLKRMKINVEIRYFLTSEYGTDKNCTHRPHYHLLLFVSSRDLHPYKLSSLICDCWNYGRTDGVKYKPMSYVRKYTFGYYGNAENRKSELLRVCNYVSKYVTKCSEFQSVIDSRITDIHRCIVCDNDGFPIPAFDDEQLKDLCKSISMTHKQSQGYGLGYLTNIDEDERQYMLSTNRMRIPSSKDVVTSIPLPLYYIRKLYYRVVVETFHEPNSKPIKKYRWVLNTDGVEWKKKYMLSSITDSVNLYEDYLLNMSLELKEHINKYLGSRTLLDFVVYRNLFKGRLKYSLDFTSLLADNTTESIIEHIVTYNNDFDDNFIYKYNSSAFSPRHFVTASKTPLYFDDKCHYFDVNYISNALEYEPIELFIEKNVYNDKSYLEFKDFDKIDSLFNLYIKTNGLSQQRTYNEIENLKRRFKYIYHATSVINL